MDRSPGPSWKFAQVPSARCCDRIHAALRSYTTWAARQLFLESRTGSLEGGKDADIAVWDRNPYDMPSSELRNLHCEMTLLAGDIVFDAHDDKGAQHGQN